MKALGLDVGERRIGLAVSDPLGMLASPVGFISRKSLERDCREVLRLAQERQVERIIVGMPLSQTGEMGPQAQRVQRFVEALREVSTVPVETWDERFSTFEAEEMLRRAGVKPSREKGRADAASAAVILQSYLDSIRSRPG